MRRRKVRGAPASANQSERTGNIEKVVNTERNAGPILQINPVVVHEAEHFLDRNNVLHGQLVEVGGNVAAYGRDYQSKRYDAYVDMGEDPVAL